MNKLIKSVRLLTKDIMKKKKKLKLLIDPMLCYFVNNRSKKK